MLFCSAAIVCATGAFAQTDTATVHEMSEVVVSGVRAGKTAPFAVAHLGSKELNVYGRNGRELPFLLAQTPGVLAWGENGIGTGTVAMRIRGAAGSRINVTLDGVALNSPEDQTVFWANMNSYASLLGSVQIQRGIGTSTNGDGAFGGSVSLNLAEPGENPSAELTGSVGSYGTYHTGIGFSTGRLPGGFTFDGAFHETGTDGFVDGTSGRSGCYYGSLTWTRGRFRWAYRNLGNFEKTGQAWNGVVAGSNNLSLIDGTFGEKTGIRTYKDLYDRGLGRFNPLYEQLVTDASGTFVKDASGDYKTERFRMRDGSYWRKTTDNFYQNHNLLSLTFRSPGGWSHAVSLHYTYGYGYYREFRQENKFSKFGLTFYDADGKLVKRSDFVRRKGLSQHTYGLVYNIGYRDADWDLKGGMNLQQFRGTHFGYLTYIAREDADAQYRPGGRDYRYYDSDAHKDDYSAYVKLGRCVSNFWTIFTDAQVRRVEYKTDGVNDRFYKDGAGYRNQQLDISRRYVFINPKVGLSYSRDGHKAYASFAYAHREPERNNFTDNGSYPAPSPERMADFELGYQYAGSGWHAGANFYRMNYNGQFVQTGAQSDIGENLTTNVRRSYRTGVELEAGCHVSSWLSLEGNAALSRNVIRDFDEMAAENWGTSYRKIHYDHSTLAFSPSVILNGLAEFNFKGFAFVWHTNFVGRQYLDNTENALRALPCYSQSDANASYTIRTEKNFAGIRTAIFGINLGNVFNRHYAASGWVYSCILDGNRHPNENRYTQIGFVPMAGFTLTGNITLRF